MGKYIFRGIVVLVILVAVAFGLEFLGLKWTKFFAPKRANVQREVFEETKSYVHGKIQDLAKYYEEWQKAESTADKEAVESVIKMNFAEFDETNIKNDKLRRFLTQVRGY